MIQNIVHKKTILAKIIRSSYLKKKGINFFTSNKLSQQVAYMNHPKGYTIDPHTHKKNTRTISGTSEVLIILQGKLKIDSLDKFIPIFPPSFFEKFKKSNV